MKIKTRHITWEQLAEKEKLRHPKPKRPWFLLHLLIRLLSIPSLLAVRFSFREERMEKAGKGPYLILMNHSSFLDLKIASRLLFPMPYHIVATSDAFVGKSLLMRLIGCIPTQKFVTDVSLVMDLIRVVKKHKTSVLMYPEAGYTLDGRTTVLPRRLGGLVKRLGVPLIMIRTDAGGFLRDPLYNDLRLRKVRVSAVKKCLLTREEIAAMTIDEIDRVIDEAFSFDHFAEQREKKIAVTEPFRAEGLEKLLYRCPRCEREGGMKTDGSEISCSHCGVVYRMDEYGVLHAAEGETEFSHIPDWYDWERECVRQEIARGEYRLEVPVEIAVITDHKALYRLRGGGILTHDETGLTLKSNGGEFTMTQDPYAAYTLNVEFFFYELGDVISLGTKERVFYCFLPEGTLSVKARLAAEEFYLLPKKSTVKE